MGNLVKYHNEMNEVNFNGYNEKELNLFFSLVFLAKEEKSNKLVIPFSELKELSNGDIHNERFIKNLENVNKKLIKLSHRIEVDGIIHIFSLFNVFSIDPKEKILTVQVNEIFGYMLNDLIGNFTKFDLLEFVKLKSIYSKNMFKLLKQWESIKIKEFDLFELRNSLGVPIKFDTSNFNRLVLKPIEEELPQYFHKLKLEKIKTKNKVTSIKFTWGTKQKEIEKKQDYIIKISSSLNETIEQTKTKNRFIKPLLTVDNIEELQKMFKEEELIKGLKHSCKTIRTSISSLNYLKKSIENGIEQNEKQLAIFNDEPKENKTDQKINPNEQLCIKTKVSTEEYENIYQEYLKTNNVKDSKIIRKSWENMNKDKFEIIEEKEDKDSDGNIPPNYPSYEECSPETQKKIDEFNSKQEVKEKLTTSYFNLTKTFREKESEFLQEIGKANILIKPILLLGLKQCQQSFMDISQIKAEIEYLEITQEHFIQLKNDLKVLEEKMNIKTDLFEILTKLSLQLTKDEFIGREIKKEIPNFETLHTTTQEEEIKKIITLKDIPEEQLKSKAGNLLVGGALISRLKKIAKEMKISIQYKEKIIDCE